MATITIAVPEERMTRLKEVAARFGLTPEELVRVSLDELLSRPTEAFQHAVDHVLDKNAELYRRLS